MSKYTPWNEQTVETITTLWKSRTASEIASMLWDRHRIVVTRNAVVGKLHRLGLTVEQKSEIHPMTRGAVKGTAKSERQIRLVSSKRPPTLSAEIIALRCDEIAPLHIGLQELTDATCKFPYGDGPFTFCGRQTKSESPYCVAHHHVCRVPAMPSKPKARIWQPDFSRRGAA